LLFQGCPSPIVVKFADTEKEKLQKKMQQMVTLGGMGMNIGLGMGFPYFQHANYNAACQQVRRGFSIIFNDVVCYRQTDRQTETEKQTTLFKHDGNKSCSK